MKFDKKQCCDIKGYDIHRKEASQSNLSNLRGTQNYLRFDHDFVKIIKRIEIVIDIANDRACRFRFGFERIEVRHDQPSDFIARIYNEQIPRIDK